MISPTMCLLFLFLGLCGIVNVNGDGNQSAYRYDEPTIVSQGGNLLLSVNSDGTIVFQTGRNQINLTSLATMDWVQSVLLPLAAFATQANARLGVLEQSTAASAAAIAGLNVAGFQTDFQPNGRLTAGWSYMWNANGGIGQRPYSPLLYNSLSNTWVPDLSSFPSPTGSFLTLSPNGGAGGYSSTQSGSGGLNRYAIAAYTVSAPGVYYLSNTTVKSSAVCGTGLFVRIYVNDLLIKQTFVPALGNITFNTILGNLVLGDAVYVAAAPSVAGSCAPLFTWDFTLRSFTSDNQAAVMAASDIVSANQLVSVSPRSCEPADTGALFTSGGNIQRCNSTTVGIYVSAMMLNSTLASYVTSAMSSNISATLANYVLQSSLNTQLSSYLTTSAYNTNLTSTLTSYVQQTSLSNQLQSYLTTSVFGSNMSATLANYVLQSSLTTQLSSYLVTSAYNTNLTSTLTSYVQQTSLSTQLQSYLTTSTYGNNISSTLVRYAPLSSLQALNSTLNFCNFPTPVILNGNTTFCVGQPAGYVCSPVCSAGYYLQTPSTLTCIGGIWTGSASCTFFIQPNCLAILTAAPLSPSGTYAIDPDGVSGPVIPFSVTCDMQTAGGGWTLLVASYASTLTTSNTRTYLYTNGGSWYQSPRTNIVWSYTASATLAGQYQYSSPAVNGSFHCSGSTETMGFGVGCSMGVGTQLKVLVQTAPNGALGQGTLCQDAPNIFGTFCVTAQFWERASSYSVPPTCQAILLANPGSVSGNYFIDPDGLSGGLAPFSVYCEMSLNGGGYTQLIPSVVSMPLFTSASARVYLYTFNGRWYQSPASNRIWSWSSGQTLTGAYSYYNGIGTSSFFCVGSVEIGFYGIGCSNGVGSNLKVLMWSSPVPTPTPASALAPICNDQPNAFGSTCALATVYVKFV